MFVTEIRPLNKKKSRILFDDGEDLVLYNGEIRASRIKEQEELRRAKNEITKDAYWKLQSSLNSLSSDELSKKLFQSEIIELFSRELAKMPELTRAVYQASRQEGLTYQQIAERYNISTRQVASEMQRAYAQLRVPLKDYLPVIGLLFAMLSK